MTVKDIKDKELYINKAREAEKKYNIPENTLVGLLAQESGHFNKDVISGKKKSYAGAIGIGQFMPKTAQFYKIDPLNVDQAIDASAKYLASSFNTFKNWDDAILSYNAGVGRVKEYKAGKPIKIKEHSEYVGRVKNQINRYGAGKLTNPKENITPELTDFDFTPQTATFALEDSNVEEEIPKEEDKNKEVAQAKEVLKEEQFMSDMFKGKITPIQLAQEEAPQQAPQSNLLESFSNIESFVDTPLAQQGLTVPRKKMSLEELDAKMKQTRALLDKGKVQQSNLKERPKEVVRESTQTTFRNETGRQVNTNPNQQISTKHVNERRTESQIIADRKKAVEESIKAQDESIIGNPNWRQTLATQTQSTGDKFRIFPNEDSFIDNYLNPAVMVGDMAKNLGQAPLQAQQQDSYMPYITSIGTPLAAGAMAGYGTQGNGQFVNNLVNPLAGTGDVIDKLGNKYLPNVHKLNPMAFKPKEGRYYRQVFGENVDPLVTRSMSKNKDHKGINAYINAKEDEIFNNKGEKIIDVINFKSKEALPYFNKNKLFYPRSKEGVNETLLESKNKLIDYEDFYPSKIKAMSQDPKQYKAADEIFGEIRMLSPFSKTGHDINSYNVYKKDWLQGYKKIQEGGYTEDEQRFITDYFQQGGQIPISSKGMWEFPNQKVVVPTNGSITMKNIPHKIKATSLETGETKILLPGLEYFFDKTQNVLEIPLKK